MLRFRWTDHAPGATALLLTAALVIDAYGATALHASIQARLIMQRVVRVQEYVADDRPVRLRIPAIGVDAPVTDVGLRSDGLMDIPSTSTEVGWFSLGFRPGSPGNAVMAGHLDTQLGKPAVFWDLRRLKTGDVVEVVRADGTVLRFAVKEKRAYQMSGAPMERIFGAASGAMLNLVTCNGEWQEHLRTYNRRLVVYTQEIR